MQSPDIYGLWTPRAFLQVETHFLPGFELLISFAKDGAVMDEDIGCTISFNESESLRVIEPLHFSLFHDASCGIDEKEFLAPHSMCTHEHKHH